MRHRFPDILSAVMITMDSLAKRRVKYTANAEIPRIYNHILIGVAVRHRSLHVVPAILPEG